MEVTVIWPYCCLFIYELHHSSNCEYCSREFFKKYFNYSISGYVRTFRLGFQWNLLLQSYYKKLKYLIYCSFIDSLIAPNQYFASSNDGFVFRVSTSESIPLLYSMYHICKLAYIFAWYIGCAIIDIYQKYYLSQYWPLRYSTLYVSCIRKFTIANHD